MPRKIRLVLEYDGTNYAGWQIQARGEATIQAEIERAVEKVTGKSSRVHCAGRTDAGVHAGGQVAHFTTESAITAARLAAALNQNLPGDIAVLKSEEVPMSFDARRDARGKVYRYCILNRPIRSPTLRRRVWHIREPLDLKSIQEAADRLTGEHDFSSFQGTGCAAGHPVRYVYLLEVKKPEPEMVAIDVFATAFLKHMVRNIVGTLVHVGLGKLGPEEMTQVLEAKDRRAAGPTAPARGLELVRVFYPFDPPPPELLRLVPERLR